MLYFSEVKGKKVLTEDLIEIGYLEDLIFLASENPQITKILIKNKKNEKQIIPVSFLRRINSNIIISKEFVTDSLVENELYVLRNILDKQIIDLVGSKIVRVNDIALIWKNNLLYLSGVDIGLLGVVRWFKLENIICRVASLFNIKIVSRFLSWADIQPLELTSGFVKLKKESAKLNKIKPADLADYLEQTNIKNVRKLLGILDEEFAANVISNLNINYQASLIKHFDKEKAAVIIKLIDPDEAVDVLLTIPKKRREEIIDLLDPDKKKELNYLMFLSKTPIGDILTTEFITVSPNNTIREVINIIKSDTQGFYFFNIIYVVNENKQVVGVFNLHEMLMQDIDTPVYKFMIQDVIVVHLTTPREIVLKKMLKYRIMAVPVIDADKHILGIVTYDDISQFILKKLV